MAAIPRRPVGVAIDGDQVRQIREQKELTQLYIAEVVGVSVDTVSRWENNRTQAIRTDNVQALAKALEVPVEEITLTVKADPVPATGSPRTTAGWMLAIVAAALATTLLTWWALRPALPVLEATRRLPAYAAPGTAVPVRVQVRVTKGEVPRVVLREQLPPGWAFVGAVPAPDRGPDTNGEVRWILPVTDHRGTVTYVVRSAADAEESSAHRFAGEVVSPGKTGRQVPVQGEQRIDLEYIYWADEDGDFEVGDSEVLDALERIEAAPDLGVGSDVLRTLWGAGEYTWDPQEKVFHPLP